MKEMRIPCLLSSQLQGRAKRGCAMVKRSALRVTYVEVILKVYSITTFMLEKV